MNIIIYKARLSKEQINKYIYIYTQESITQWVGLKKKKKQKFKILTDGQILTVDFVIYPWVRFEKSQIRNPHSPTIDFPLPTASLTGATLGQSASQRAPSVPSDLSLSLGVDRSELPFSLCVSRFFFSFFYLLTALDLSFGVLWRVIFITPKAFFFFLIPLTVLYFTVCIYIYIYLFVLYSALPYKL